MLSDITLAFYPGAKIGVLGYNGAGKSTCCGSWPASTPSSAATRSSRPARPSACSSRSRSSTSRRTCAATSRRASRRRRRCWTASTSWPRTTPTRPPTSSPTSRRRSTPPTRGTSTPRSTTRWTRCAARRPTPTSTSSPAASAAASRSAGCCSRKPDLLLLDEPTNHLDAESVAWLERHLAEYPGTVVAVTHDRYFLDNVAGWILELDRGTGIPYEGNYSSWLEQKQKRLAAGGEAREERASRTIAAELEWVRQNPKGRQQEAEGAPEQLRGAASPQERNVKLDQVQIHIPAGPRLGRRRRRGRGPAQGLRRQAADRGPVVLAAARRHRRRHRRQRRRQDDAVPHDHRPGAARRGRAARRRHGRARLRRPVAATRSTARRPSGRRSPTARTRSRSASSG